MALLDINWHPVPRDLRIFAGLLIPFGMIVAGILYTRCDSITPSLVMLIVTGVGGLLGLVAPQLIRPVYVVWMALAFPIGWTVSHLLMLAVFYLVITPIGLMMRLCGRDPMQRRWDRSAKSYWLARPRHDDPPRYFRQF